MSNHHPAKTQEELVALFQQDLTTGVGRSVKHDSADKHVSGEAVYIDDRLEFPNQLHVYARLSDRAHARIISVDVSPCYDFEGVRIAITHEDIPGLKDIGPLLPGDPLLAIDKVEFVGQPVIAVAARDLETARKAAMAAIIEYEDLEPVLDVVQAYRDRHFVLDSHTHQRGDSAVALETAPNRIQGTLHIGGQEHFYLETQISSVMPTEDGGMIVYCSTQNPTEVQKLVAEVLDVSMNKVVVDMRRMGGGFGRRYYNDFVIEAALLAKETSRPVKLVWTREDEMTQDYFGQSTFARLKAGVDKQGKLIAWHHRQGQIEGSMREQCFPYQLIDNFRVDSYQQRAGTPTGAWRGPGHFQFAFATESMIDEVAHAVNQDPLAYRLDLMGKPKSYPYRGYGATEIDSGRMAKCYQAAADLAKWQQKRPKGVGLGIASHFTFGSYAAFVVEVDSRGKDGMKITGIWGAIDCGLPLNPNHIRNQMEGGFIDGLNASIYNDAKIEGGRVMNSNFDQQPWIRMADTPALFEVAIIENDYPPTGVGEPPTAPAAAALANAIFAATGKRQRKLPISMEA